MTDIANKGLTSPPATVTLVGSGADLEGRARGGGRGGRHQHHPATPASPATWSSWPPTPDASVLAAALAAGRPQDTVGLYAGGGKLAELVITRLTSPAAAATAEALAGQLGLSVVLAPDRPGFLAGTLLYPHLADAVRMVPGRLRLGGRRGHGDDAGLRLPARARWSCWTRPGLSGPLAVLSAMHDAYGDPAFAPPPLLAEHAAAGLGFRG